MKGSKNLVQTKLVFSVDGNLDIIKDKSSKPPKKTSKSSIPLDIEIKKKLPLPNEYRPPKDLNQYCAPLPVVPNDFNIRTKLPYLETLLVELINKAQKAKNMNLEAKIKEHYKILDSSDARLLISMFKREITADERYYKRLATEFRLIQKKQFTKVFIQVLDILSIASRLEIPHIIRGSAGSSLICYLLRITDIDPITETISLARFMHNLRDDLPDIDMDFPSNRRDEIYCEIFKTYGNRVARISNHVKYSEKTAIKQAIRESGVKRMIPKEFDLMDYVPDIMAAAKVLQRAEELEGEFKHYSLHCGGIIIFDKPIPQEYILAEHEEGNARIPEIAWQQVSLNKDQVDDYMFIKIDILSNRGLTELWDIDKRDIETYPSDPLVYDALARGENIGIVYAESRAMRKALVCLQPSDIQGIALALAIIRPVAREHKSAYFKDYRDYKAIKDDYTSSTPISNTTNNNKQQQNNIEKNSEKHKKPLECGVQLGDYIIYDDDAIQFIQRLIGCNEADADIYRKAFAKGKKWKMKEFENRLRAKHPEFEEDKILLIYDQLCNLQAYSFCKSHAISYAKLVYALAYNRVYKPVEFWVSALNNCNSSYRKWVYYREAAALGIRLTRGYSPWQYEDATQSLVSLAGKSVPMFPEDSKIPLEQDEINKLEYFRLGYWCHADFISGCHLTKDKETTKKHRKIIQSDNDTTKNNNKNIEEYEVYLWRFKGLISNYRCCKTWKRVFNEGTQTSNVRERAITFCTIGYDNAKYIDIVLYGKIGLGKCHLIEGVGTMQDEDHASWIKVDKWHTVML
jgi:hypothetical protein